MKAEILVYILIACVFLAILLTPVEMAQEFIRRRREFKKAKKDIEYDIRTWTSIAKSCDPIEEASDKGYAIARLVIYHHELDELIEERQRELCS